MFGKAEKRNPMLQTALEIFGRPEMVVLGTGSMAIFTFLANKILPRDPTDWKTEAAMWLVILTAYSLPYRLCYRRTPGDLSGSSRPKWAIERL